MNGLLQWLKTLAQRLSVLFGIGLLGLALNGVVQPEQFVLDEESGTVLVCPPFSWSSLPAIPGKGKVFVPGRDIDVTFRSQIPVRIRQKSCANPWNFVINPHHDEKEYGFDQMLLTLKKGERYEFVVTSLNHRDCGTACISRLNSE
jgi:hypothetical protein